MVHTDGVGRGDATWLRKISGRKATDNAGGGQNVALSVLKDILVMAMSGSEKWLVSQFYGTKKFCSVKFLTVRMRMFILKDHLQYTVIHSLMFIKMMACVVCISAELHSMKVILSAHFSSHGVVLASRGASTWQEP